MYAVSVPSDTDLFVYGVNDRSNYDSDCEDYSREDQNKSSGKAIKALVTSSINEITEIRNGTLPKTLQMIKDIVKTSSSLRVMSYKNATVIDCNGRDSGNSKEHPDYVVKYEEDPLDEVLKKVTQIHENVTQHSNKLKVYECEMCKFFFAKMEDFYEHLKSEHESDTLKFTHIEYASHQLLLVTENKHIKVFNYQCPKCDLRFQSNALLKQHEVRKLFRCVKCHIDIDDCLKFRDHIYSCTSEEHVICPCGKRFIKDKNYDLHITVCKEYIASEYDCIICHSNFGNTEDLLEHQISEHKVSSDHRMQVGTTTCKDCMKKYVGFRDLHDCQYSNSKPYMCPMCKKTFRTNLLRSVHLKAMKKNHAKCVKCNKPFVLECEKEHHVCSERQNLEVSYRCEICKKYFQDSEDIYTHLQLEHMRHFTAANDYISLDLDEVDTRSGIVFTGRDLRRIPFAPVKSISTRIKEHKKQIRRSYGPSLVHTRRKREEIESVKKKVNRTIISDDSTDSDSPNDIDGNDIEQNEFLDAKRKKVLEPNDVITMETIGNYEEENSLNSKHSKLEEVGHFDREDNFVSRHDILKFAEIMDNNSKESTKADVEIYLIDDDAVDITNTTSLETMKRDIKIDKPVRSNIEENVESKGMMDSKGKHLQNIDVHVKVSESYAQDSTAVNVKVDVSEDDIDITDTVLIEPTKTYINTGGTSSLNGNKHVKSEFRMSFEEINLPNIYGKPVNAERVCVEKKAAVDVKLEDTCGVEENKLETYVIKDSKDFQSKACGREIIYMSGSREQTENFSENKKFMEILLHIGNTVVDQESNTIHEPSIKLEKDATFEMSDVNFDYKTENPGQVMDENLLYTDPLEDTSMEIKKEYLENADSVFDEEETNIDSLTGDVILGVEKPIERKPSLEQNVCCSLCLRNYKNLTVYYKHFIHHNLDINQCPYCKVIISDSKQFPYHCIEHVVMNYRKYILMDANTKQLRKVNKCTLCNVQIERKYALVHYEYHSLENIDINYEDIPQFLLVMIIDILDGSRKEPLESECILCGEKEFDLKDHLIEHLYEDAENKKYQNFGIQCQICYRYVIGKDKKSFNKHMNKHCAPSLHECGICKMSFVSMAGYKRHTAKVHFEVQCNHCEEKFASDALLSQHINNEHDSLKPLHCDVCQMAFYFQPTLDEHVKLFHEEPKSSVRLHPVATYGRIRKPLKRRPATTTATYSDSASAENFNHRI